MNALHKGPGDRHGDPASAARRNLDGNDAAENISGHIQCKVTRLLAKITRETAQNWQQSMLWQVVYFVKLQ